ERLNALTDADLSRPGKHLSFGNVTVQSTLMVVLGHRRGHLFQHRSNLVAMRAQHDGRVPAEAYAISGAGGPTLVLLDAVASKWDPVVAALGGDYRIVQVKVAAFTTTLEQLRRDLNLDELWLAGMASSA